MVIAQELCFFLLSISFDALHCSRIYGKQFLYHIKLDFFRLFFCKLFVNAAPKILKLPFVPYEHYLYYINNTKRRKMMHIHTYINITEFKEKRQQWNIFFFRQRILSEIGFEFHGCFTSCLAFAFQWLNAKNFCTKTFDIGMLTSAWMKSNKTHTY